MVNWAALAMRSTSTASSTSTSPPRKLQDIDEDLNQVEAEIAALLAEVASGMSQYRACSAYKDSGIEWIGRCLSIEELRVKRLASPRNERRTMYLPMMTVQYPGGW
jgi:hypothetical protein